MNIWMNGWMNNCMSFLFIHLHNVYWFTLIWDLDITCKNEWMTEQINKWVNERINEWMNNWMNNWMSLLFFMCTRNECLLVLSPIWDLNITCRNEWLNESMNESMNESINQPCHSLVLHYFESCLDTSRNSITTFSLSIFAKKWTVKNLST